MRVLGAGIDELIDSCFLPVHYYFSRQRPRHNSHQPAIDVDAIEMVLQPALYGLHSSWFPLNFFFFGLHLVSPFYEQCARELVFGFFVRYRRKNLFGLAVSQKKNSKKGKLLR